MSGVTYYKGLSKWYPPECQHYQERDNIPTTNFAYLRNVFRMRAESIP